MERYIDRIIEKYFEGETTLEEEKVLRDYFMQPQIDEKHEIYRAMFQFFSGEREKAADESKPANNKKRYLIRICAGIAAGVLLIVGVQFFRNSRTEDISSQSLVYIDGKEITDKDVICLAALNSIQNISYMNEDIVSTQVDILDSFIE